MKVIFLLTLAPGGTISETDYPSTLGKFKFAPVMSVYAEQSFSVYKNILSDNRLSLSLENMNKIIACFFAAKGVRDNGFLTYFFPVSRYELFSFL